MATLTYIPTENLEFAWEGPGHFTVYVYPHPNDCDTVAEFDITRYVAFDKLTTDSLPIASDAWMAQVTTLLTERTS